MTAAIALIVEGGYHALSMDRIATRAGVSKAALYRRWPNKLELVVDAIGHRAVDRLVMPDTGDVRRDLVELLTGFLSDKRADAKTYESLGAAVFGDPELAARCRHTLVASFTAGLRLIVERGVRCGQLPPDTDVDLLSDVAPALIRHRHQQTGQPLDETFIERIAAQFFKPAGAAVPVASGDAPRGGGSPRAGGMGHRSR